MSVRHGNIVQPHVTVPNRGASFGTVPLKERFWAKVDKSTGECWLWIGAHDKRGRGEINVNGKPRSASRVSWELHNGQISEGLFVLHRCDVPACVRPDHLFLGNQADNMEDAKKKGRSAWVGRERLIEMLSRPEVKTKRSLKMKNTRWVNNGRVNRRHNLDGALPEGWSFGRLPYKRVSWLPEGYFDR